MSLLQRFRKFVSGNKHAAVTLSIYTFLGIATFLIGFTLFFPDALLQPKLQYEISRSFPGEIRINTISYRFPLHLEAEDVLVKMNDRRLPEFHFDTIHISPHLASLIGKPGVCFKATTREGAISGSFSRSGEFNIEITDFSFDEPVLGFTDLRLSGEINDARIESHLQPAPDTVSVVKLKARKLGLSGLNSAGLAINRLNLGNLTINIDGKGNNLVVSEAVLSGGEIQAEADGRVVTGKSVQSTRINLEVQIKPAANLDPSVASLIELIGSPAPDGSRKLSIGGTFARPRVK